MADEDWVAELWEEVRPAAAARVETLSSLVASGDDATEAVRLAHSLAGSFGSYGHHDGSLAASELERLLLDGGGTDDEGRAAALLERMRGAAAGPQPKTR